MMHIPASLRQLRDARMRSMCLPALVFFEPKDSFFDALAPFKGTRIVEAGAGMGHVTREAAARGFNMVAVDLAGREVQWEQVQHIAAESMPYGPDTWLLMCRPDHSGWAYDTMEIALRAGATVFYAGLERNFSIDLGEYVGRETQRWENVGEEGESLFMFEPASLLPPYEDEL